MLQDQPVPKDQWVTPVGAAREDNRGRLVNGVKLVKTVHREFLDRLENRDHQDQAARKETEEKLGVLGHKVLKVAGGHQDKLDPRDREDPRVLQETVDLMAPRVSLEKRALLEKMDLPE